MSVINTNITSMIGQSNLNKSQNALQTSMERLSSGLRINSAKDDAAGQAIANRMTAQITGLSQAQRNANDGISVSQTAEGALNQVNDNLQRIRELTVQAQNGTNSADDLQSIQDEIGQRLNEIDRISEETNFNGVKVLAENQTIKIQVGANDGESISVNLQEVNKTSLSLDSFTVQGQPSLTQADQAGTTLNDGTDDFTVVASGADTTMGATEINEADIAITNNALTGGTNTLHQDENNNLYVRHEADDGTVSIFEVDGTTNTSTFTKADATSAATLAVSIDATAEADGNLTPLQTIDSALNQVDSLRSELGAIQNRFESAITNLQTNETNLAAARSRIEDADYAVEVANMTRAQILQQAGTSVLAQANQVPQNVLSLLG